MCVPWSCRENRQNGEHPWLNVLPTAKVAKEMSTLTLLISYLQSRINSMQTGRQVVWLWWGLIIQSDRKAEDPICVFNRSWNTGNTDKTYHPSSIGPLIVSPTRCLRPSSSIAFSAGKMIKMIRTHPASTSGRSLHLGSSTSNHRRAEIRAGEKGLKEEVFSGGNSAEWVLEGKFLLGNMLIGKLRFLRVKPLRWIKHSYMGGFHKWGCPLIIHFDTPFMEAPIWMWLKQCHKPAMTGNNKHDTYLAYFLLC